MDPFITSLENEIKQIFKSNIKGGKSKNSSTVVISSNVKKNKKEKSFSETSS
jgi:hypothetical protein